VPEPCPCEGDINGDGQINLQDGNAIVDCYQSGDCSNCVNSCDVNCDGMVNQFDANPDLLEVDSFWLCLFEGGTAEMCCGPTGACCDSVTGVCHDGLRQADCQAKTQSWTPGALCGDITCQPAPMGACCNTATGVCEDGLLEAECADANEVWTEGAVCSTAVCPLPPTGACCHTGNGGCEDGVLQIECSAEDEVWTEGASCADVDCSAPQPSPCTCNADVDDDGSLLIIDGICILDCYLNDDCSCCVNSCDINCDGVVDGLDAHIELIDVESTWLCLFQGGAPHDCCGLNELIPPHRSAADPSMPADTSDGMDVKPR